MYNSIWYQNLTRPALSPPNWIFTPIWSILYILIFTSLAIYIQSYVPDKKIGYVYFIIQMLLNIFWSPVFFGLKNIIGALTIVILLDIFVILTIIKFFQASKIAGIILIPYLIWILFATYLNFGYLILN